MFFELRFRRWWICKLNSPTCKRTSPLWSFQLQYLRRRSRSRSSCWHHRHHRRRSPYWICHKFRWPMTSQHYAIRWRRLNLLGPFIRGSKWSSASFPTPVVSRRPAAAAAGAEISKNWLVSFWTGMHLLQCHMHAEIKLCHPTLGRQKIETKKNNNNWKLISS